MKYIVCFSGGHSSALIAVEAVRKAGKENVILLNHDISPNYVALKRAVGKNNEIKELCI